MKKLLFIFLSARLCVIPAGTAELRYFVSARDSDKGPVFVESEGRFEKTGDSVDGDVIRPNPAE